MLETLEESVMKEKHPESSFLALPICNIHHVWLILPFGIGSNLFKLLCIEVISKQNILFLLKRAQSRPNEIAPMTLSLFFVKLAQVSPITLKQEVT